MTDPASTISDENLQSITVSGYGYHMVIDGKDRTQIYDAENKPVTDMIASAGAKEKLVLALQQKITTMSANVKMTLGTNNGKPVQTYLPGELVEDGSYYIGISETTNTDLFLFPELIKHVGFDPNHPASSHDQGTTLLREKNKKSEIFHSHLFSKFQLDGSRRNDEISKSYNDGTADGGIRRLTVAELLQTHRLLEKNQEFASNAKSQCSYLDGAIQSSTLVHEFTAASVYKQQYAVEPTVCQGLSQYTGGLLICGRTSPAKPLLV